MQESHIYTGACGRHFTREQLGDHETQRADESRTDTHTHKERNVGRDQFTHREGTKPQTSSKRDKDRDSKRATETETDREERENTNKNRQRHKQVERDRVRYMKNK